VLCAVLGRKTTTSVLKTHAGAVMCLHEGAVVFKKLHFMGVCGALADSHMKQAVSADYSRTRATEEEVYLHAFMNSSLLRGNGCSASSRGHFIPS